MTRSRIRSLCAALLVVGTMSFFGPGRAGAGPADDLTNPPPGQIFPGPVAIAPTVYVDYWLPLFSTNPKTGQPWHFDRNGTLVSDGQFMSTINGFIKDFGNSPLFNILTQYTGLPWQPPPVNALHFGGSWVDTTDFPIDRASQAPIVHASDIRASAMRMRSALNVPDHGSIIDVTLVPYGVYACTSENLTGCSPGTPGGHGHMTGFHPSTIPDDLAALGAFAIDGQFRNDQANPSNPPNPFPQGHHPSPSLAADLTVSPISHEIMEAITDPFGHSWRSPDKHSSGADQEIGDMCETSATPRAPVNRQTGANVVLNGHGYFLQREYSDAVHDCAPDLCPKTGVCQEALHFQMSAAHAAVQSAHHLRIDFTVKDPGDITSPHETDTSYEQDARVTFTYPDSGATQSYSTDLDAIGVDDERTGHVGFIADAQLKLTQPTTQKVCGTLDYTDSLGNPRPSIRRCTDFVVTPTPSTGDAPTTTGTQERKAQ